MSSTAQQTTDHTPHKRKQAPAARRFGTSFWHNYFGNSVRSHPWIRIPSIPLQLQERGDENGGPPGRYRPARCGNTNPGFVEPAPPGEDKVISPDQKSVHTSTTPTNRGKKRWSAGSIPPRTVWKPQPGVRRASATRGG